jgi:CDP-glucose 4,6-dehydratase
MRVLISGADGFLGATLCKMLMEQGHYVTATSLNRANETSLTALNVNCRIEYGDILDKEFVNRIISSSEAEVVFHLAAVSIVRIASQSPARTLETNIMGTVNVLDTCKRLGIKCLVASSDKAYGDHNGIPYTEELTLKPTGAYELSKACADQIGMFYGAIVVRCANLYGKGDLNWSRLIPGSIRYALQGESPHIYGDAVDQKREWMYVEDAARAYITLAECAEKGAFNVGTGFQLSPMEVGNEIARAIGCKAPEVVKKDNPFYEIKTQTLDHSKISTIWQPEWSFGKGLIETIKWYREYLCAS